MSACNFFHFISVQAPLQIQVKDKTSSTAAVSWTAPSGNHLDITKFMATAYQVGTNEKFVCEAKGRGKCGSHCTLSGLKGGSLYSVTARSCFLDKLTNHSVCGDESVEQFFKTEGNVKYFFSLFFE